MAINRLYASIAGIGASVIAAAVIYQNCASNNKEEKAKQIAGCSRELVLNPEYKLNDGSTATIKVCIEDIFVGNIKVAPVRNQYNDAEEAGQAVTQRLTDAFGAAKSMEVKKDSFTEKNLVNPTYGATATTSRQ
ncbi:MAG TPA: hypothetical protein VJI98_01235 [Candidatus Nanoarchaeia archaeon]|nr:hypothetical protein [Candidatus Nanoarchaeia archaeon]